MKALSKHRSRGLHLAVVCLLALALVSMLPARSSHAFVPSYTVTDLGPTVGVTSKAFGINNCGVISGEYAGQPAIWKVQGATVTRTDLGTFGGPSGRANAVNASNFVVGSSTLGSGVQRAFIWHDNNNNGASDPGELINLGTLNGGNTSDVYDINDLGEVVGASETDPESLSQSGVIWDRSQGMRMLNPANGLAPFSAKSINNSSDIAGVGLLTSGDFHAFLINGSSLLDLGAVAGTASFGYATEEVGGTDYVVGYLRFASSFFHAFVWNGTLQDIGTLGGPTSIAYGINASGQVVGASDVNPVVSHAFLWHDDNNDGSPTAGEMKDLNDLTMGSGWTLQEAQSINASGQIVGVGINNSDPTHTHAFLLTPTGFTSTPCSLAPTTVSAVSGTGVFNQPATLTATLNSLNGAVSGKPITFTVDGSAVCGGALPACPTTNTSGVATFPVSGYGGGAHPITASFGGDAIYATSNDSNGGNPNPGILNVSKASATITLDVVSLSQTYDGTAKGATATTTPPGLSGVTISYFQGMTPVASPTVAGDYTAVASLSNADYQAPDVNQPFKINQASSTTTVTAANTTYNGAPNGATATVTGVGGLNQSVSPITYTGRITTSYNSTTAPTNAGDYTATATFSGDANHTGSVGTKDFQITKASQTITVNTHAPASAIYNTQFTVAATSGSGLTIAYSGTPGVCTNSGATFTMISGTGTCAVKYDQVGDGNYNAATQVTENVNAHLASQAITFDSLANKTFGDAPFTVSATGGGSSNPVTFTATGNCSSGGTNGSTITISGAGSCTITASQAGDTNYSPATDVPQAFSIGKATATVTLSNLSQAFDGNAKSVTASTTPQGLNVVITYTQNNQPVTPVNLGNYDVSATINDTNYQGSASGTLVIHVPGPVLILEEGSMTRLAAIDSVTFVRGPFRILDDHNFSADHHTRIIFLTSNLGMTQPDASKLTVQAAGIPLTVEAVGPVTGVPGLDASYVIVRLEDGLPSGDVQLTVTLQGVSSTASIITIAP